jgi:hypothetical protein
MKDIGEVLKKYSPILNIKEFNDSIININGVVDEEREDFYLTPSTTEFTFCKTGNEAYDLPVCEILLILKHFYKDDFYLFSDGFWVREEDECYSCIQKVWIEALNNIKAHFGYKYKIIIEWGDEYGRLKTRIIN